MSEYKKHIPPYMDFRFGDVPGVEGVVLEARMTAYLHITHSRKSRFIKHQYSVGICISGETPEFLLIDHIKEFDKQFMDRLRIGEFEEWKYTQEGELIPGSKKVKRFNRWLLLDKENNIVNRYDYV